MNLVINSQFRPFTYDEMVKPLVQYKEAYDKVEQDYSDLVAQTEVWKDIANQENSPEAYAMYKGYADQLNSLAEAFGKEGLKLGTRKSLLNMKRGYASSIAPIARASESMKEANDFRAKAGPDAIFQVGQYNSLDDFLHGKSANNLYTSRDSLMKRAAAMTEAAMASALQDPEFKEAMGDQFWLITQHTGGSYEDLRQAIANNPAAQNRFAEIKQRVMTDAGIDRYDAAGRQAIEDAINTGLYAGLDKPVRSFQANADHITPAQRHSMNMQSAQLALSAASAGMVSDGKGGWTYDPNKDPAVARAKAKPSRSTSGGGGSGRLPRLKQALRVGTGVVGTDKGAGKSAFVEDTDVDGTLTAYGALDQNTKDWIAKAIGTDSTDNYSYYVGSKDIAGGWNDEPVVYIVPKNTVVTDTTEIDEDAH